MYIPRKIESALRKLLKQYPVITLTGPRQSGKTTLCRHNFPDYNYISLEKPDVRLRLQQDPNEFLENLSGGTIIDEAQRFPDIFSYIQYIVDNNNKPGQFILTGSAQFELLESINQSLAGRTAILKLLPFAFNEIYSKSNLPGINEILYTGFYPRIFDKKLNPSEALSYYCNTYIEKDVRTITNIKNLSHFEIFLKLCSGRTGQILNNNSIANDIGVNHNTISSWISVLDASYIAFKLRPHYKNFNKRLIKSPKLYFFDCGLACYLLDLQNPDHLKNHPLRGYLFENFIVTEIYKQQLNNNREPNLYYWRDNTGHEIDLLFDLGTTMLPVEIKSGKTVSKDYFKNLNFYMNLNPLCKKAAIIYGGDETYKINKAWIISYKDIDLLDGIDHKLNLKIN